MAPLSIRAVTRARASPEIKGPISLSARAGLPTRRRRRRSPSCGIRPSAARPTSTRAEAAAQRCPAAPKAACTMASAACARSASGSTTRWFLAPPRACTGLASAAAPACNSRAVLLRPTTLRPATSGWCNRPRAVAPSPCSTWNRPGASPQASRASASHTARLGVCGLGLAMKALPAASAQGARPISRLQGPQKGSTPTTTPSGCACVHCSKPAPACA
jgi:hypothetical protein